MSQSTAFEDFYCRRWYDAVRWATALCGDVHLGQELAQEAFLRMEPHFARIEQP